MEEELLARLMASVSSSLGEPVPSLSRGDSWDEYLERTPTDTSSSDVGSTVQAIVESMRRSALTPRRAGADTAYSSLPCRRLPVPPSTVRLRQASEDARRASYVREASRRAAFPEPRAQSTADLYFRPPEDQGGLRGDDPMDRLRSLTGGGGQPQRRGLGPQLSSSEPPPWARVFFKTVAVVGGTHVSVFDGSTAYPLSQTVEEPLSGEEGHNGGLYVCESIRECLQHDASGFPARSALLNAPRMIARVLAWNEGRHVEPARFGHKLAFRFVRAVEYLPYPASWGARIYAVMDSRHPDVVAPSHASRPQSRSESLLQAQTRTSELEADVAQMERQLAHAGIAV